MTNEPTTKTCNVCGKTRELVFFSLKQGSRDGHNGACKFCLRKGGLAFVRRAERKAAAEAAKEARVGV